MNILKSIVLAPLTVPFILSIGTAVTILISDEDSNIEGLVRSIAMLFIMTAVVSYAGTLLIAIPVFASMGSGLTFDTGHRPSLCKM